MKGEQRRDGIVSGVIAPGGIRLGKRLEPFEVEDGHGPPGGGDEPFRAQVFERRQEVDRGEPQPARGPRHARRQVDAALFAMVRRGVPTQPAEQVRDASPRRPMAGPVERKFVTVRIVIRHGGALSLILNDKHPKLTHVKEASGEASGITHGLGGFRLEPSDGTHYAAVQA